MGAAERIGRRDFLRLGLSAGAGGALAGLLPGRARGAIRRAAPGGRITLGFIGAGGIANAHLGPLLAQPDVQIVAVCDVNGPRREAMASAVDSRYGGRGCRGYGDFREMLGRPDIDAVLIATPDHWHALQAIAAAEAGKHIYSEKPFSRTVAEGRAMVEAVRRHGVVFQHGTQQRSDRLFRFAAELVRNGRIGRVHTVRIAVSGGRQGSRGTAQKPPDGLDWDMWLGPAPEAPYSPERYDNSGWYYIEDYSAGGFISGWGVHHVDSAQWGLGMDRTGPTAIEGTAVFPADGMCDTPITWQVEYTYPGVRVLFSTPDRARFGVTFEGTGGTVFVNRGEFAVQPESLAREVFDPGEIRLYRSDDHHRNWLDGIRMGRETVAPAEVGHRSQTICALSDIAIRLGRRLRWDPKTETVIGDAEASRMLGRAMRAPWRL